MPIPTGIVFTTGQGNENTAILLLQHGQYGNSLVNSCFITSIKLCNFRKRDVKASSDEDLTFVVAFLGSYKL